MSANARALGALCCALWLTASACGDSDDEQEKTISAGPRRVDSDEGTDGGARHSSTFVPKPSGSGSSGVAMTPISDLDADELEALCEDLDARFANRVDAMSFNRFACTLVGLTDAIVVGSDGKPTVDTTECGTSAERCQRISSGGVIPPLDCDALTLVARGCDLPVDTITSCHDAEIERVAAAVDMASCTSLTTLDAIEAFLGGLVSSHLPACKEVADECPKLLPKAGPDTPGAPAFDGCDDTCDTAFDGVCEDGGDRSELDTCVFGSDCSDCGRR